MTHEHPSRSYHVVQDTEPPPLDDELPVAPAGRAPAASVPPPQAHATFKVAAPPQPLNAAPLGYTPPAAPYPLYSAGSAAPAMAYAPLPEVHVHMETHAAPQPVAAPRPEDSHNPPRPVGYKHMASHIVDHVKSHIVQVLISLFLLIIVPFIVHMWQMQKLGPPKPMFPNLPAPSLTGATNLHSDNEPTPVLTARERGVGLPAAANSPSVSQILSNPADAMAGTIMSAVTGEPSAAPQATGGNLAEATFTGGGRYEVYRQGALTWRFDTHTGHACVLYAPDSLWYRPVIAADGCTGDE
jgi:hypothetical protein